MTTVGLAVSDSTVYMLLVGETQVRLYCTREIYSEKELLGDNEAKARDEQIKMDRNITKVLFMILLYSKRNDCPISIRPYQLDLGIISTSVVPLPTFLRDTSVTTFGI